MSKYQLAGVRVLIVEDEPLIAMDLEQICLEYGAADVTIASTVEALPALDLAAFDVAVVDRHVAGKFTDSFAHRLQTADKPFVFASGYAHELELADFPGVPLVQKPYATTAMLEAIAKVLHGRG